MYYCSEMLHIIIIRDKRDERREEANHQHFGDDYLVKFFGKEHNKNKSIIEYSSVLFSIIRIRIPYWNLKRKRERDSRDNLKLQFFLSD